MMEMLTNGTRVYMSRAVRFGADPILLARFAAVRQDERVLDAGCGCGIVALALRDEGHRVQLVAADIDEDACALARRGSDDCAAPFEVVCTDIRDYRVSRQFDVMLCNPPFFHHGIRAEGWREHARHDDTLTLAELCCAARRLVREGGRLVLCLRPDRLADGMTELRAAGLEPKRLRLCRHSAGHTPWLALLEGRRGAGVGLDIEPDYIAVHAPQEDKT